MDTPALKSALIQLIGAAIDEQSVAGANSFVEMDHAVIHYAGDGGERYFRVTLTECSEAEYDEPVPP